MKKSIFALSFLGLCIGLSSCEEPTGGGFVNNGSNPSHNDTTPEIVNPIDPVEPLSGTFSVSATKQIRFASGNLQYTRSTDKWSFAAQQYEILGTNNVLGEAETFDATYGYKKHGNALADKIDLFGFSSNAVATKWGVSTSENDADYAGDFVDWGQNIGDGQSWHTLTYEEWEYLLDTRRNAEELQGVVRINLTADGSEYVNGLILLPDNWTCPKGVTFKTGLAGGYLVESYAAYQTISLADWKKLEQAGAVFLPAAGDRTGADIFGVQAYGDYWAVTQSGTNGVNCLEFYADMAGAFTNDHHSTGISVRLVQDAGEIPIPARPLDGIFSISATQKIKFSSGNLQYIQSTATWSFAKQQYEILGMDNVVGDGSADSFNAANGYSRVGAELADTIDLFGWSGSSATYAKWGINLSVNNEEYGGDFLDWGLNIDDGETWRTLSHNEWVYLINNRPNARSLYGMARINLDDANASIYVNGLVLLPDDWSLPKGVAFNTGAETSVDASVDAYAYHNTLTLEQWKLLEESGAVFLPASGYGVLWGIIEVQGSGNYWSSTVQDEEHAACFSIHSSVPCAFSYGNRFNRMAVRLVQDL